MSARAGGTRAGAGALLDRRFAISARGSSVRVEVLGGVTTFVTMSYILVVNPAILTAAGLPFEAVAVATAIAAAISTGAMALACNYPFALASGLGVNALVAFDLVQGRGLEWPVAMAAIVIEGLLAVILVLAGLREAVVRAVPLSLKLAIAAGIGAFIALIGLQQGGIVVNDPSTGLALGDLTGGPALIALGGLAVAIVLVARGARGAILAGIATSTALGLISGVLAPPDGIAQLPSAGDFSTIGVALEPANLADALALTLIPIVFALFMTDFFDTVGTVVGLGRASGLADREGNVPRLRRVLLVDSAAASLGGALGASSQTTYIESGAGIREGARTGLSTLVVALLFALAILFVPLLALAGQQVKLGADQITPAVAPALVIVGYLMIRVVAGIDWDTPEHALPAFLILLGIPFTYSIAAGIGLGVLGYVVAMLARRRVRDIHPIMWVLVPFFVLFFASDWLSAHVL